jgi:signal transduction histidine kinase
LWVPADDATESGAEASDARSPVAIAVPVRPADSAAGRDSFHLRALADIDGLASLWEGPGQPARLSCRLDDAMGRTLLPPAPNAEAGDAEVSATVAADGWPQAPWWLRCRFGPQREVALLGPVLSRYRTTVVLDLVILGLAIVLGVFAILESRRRRRSEARAEVEAASREFERALFHAERLSTVGRLAAGIAHEINNPLEGMSNYLRLAEDRLDSDTTAARRFLASAREGLERVAGIARGVLDHSRPHAESPGPALVADVVTRAADFVRSRPEFAAVRFDLDLPDGETKVAADPVALGQVFLNLMLNACEEQRGGGEVRVAMRREASDVVVEVADRGPGIREDHRERLFRPFTSSKGSSGLGLFICSEILRQHRGRIEVQDRPGGGALFIVRVPTAEPA